MKLDRPVSRPISRRTGTAARSGLRRHFPISCLHGTAISISSVKILPYPTYVLQLVRGGNNVVAVASILSQPFGSNRTDIYLFITYSAKDKSSKNGNSTILKMPLQNGINNLRIALITSGFYVIWRELLCN